MKDHDSGHDGVADDAQDKALKGSWVFWDLKGTTSFRKSTLLDYCPEASGAPATHPRHHFAQLSGFVPLDTKMTWEDVQKIAKDAENQKAYGKAICIYKE